MAITKIENLTRFDSDEAAVSFFGEYVEYYDVELLVKHLQSKIVRWHKTE